MLLPENRHQHYRGQEAHSSVYKEIASESVGRYKTVPDPFIKRSHEILTNEALIAFGYEQGNYGS